ncbi:MAG TPA: hypothetical protein VME18_05675 [Acidobacteriaceae bacterium]|nr:hypothetical protein [Acidobacteriaceae bacterium]
MEDRSGLNPVIAVFIAIVLVGAVVGGYIWATWVGPAHAGQVVSMTVYPIHQELSTGAELGGMDGGANVYDEVIVLANVKIRSTTKLPLFLHDMWGDLTLHNGTTQQDLAADDTDFGKVFVAYPKLVAAEKSPVERNITLQPGQQIEGQMIFHFPVSQQDWDERQSFTVTVEFLHQKPLVLPTKTAEVTTVR